MSTDEAGSADSLPPLPAALHDELLATLFGDPRTRGEALQQLFADAPTHRAALEAHIAVHLAREGDAAATTMPTIPGYQLVRQIGEGGMGVVFEAEQVAPLRRRVAIKVIRGRVTGREVIERFERERQALAVMNHDAIAKVFDCGSTPDGQPFFAMEFVDGLPIHEYCDRHRLPLHERIALFRRVCDGVQHAHQKGVVHRDLKSSNVMVTDQLGHTSIKIIDFGVARAIEPGEGGDRVAATEQGTLLGTPEYMSPEQATGDVDRIDTRSDVYSLGVVLYELLVGELPFPSHELRAGGYVEIARRLRDVEPPRPSQRIASQAATVVATRRRTTVGVLQRTLRTDLDWIVLAAMEKDPARRYPSAEALAADLLRYLQHEPVHAGPPSTRYRVRKFVRRYRAQLGATALVFTALVVGLIGTVWQRNAAVSAREQTRRRHSDLYDVLNNVFTGLNHRLVVLPGSLPARRYLQRQAGALIDNLATESNPDWQTRYLMALAKTIRANLEWTATEPASAATAEPLYRDTLAALTALAADPDAVMGDGTWRPLLPHLSGVHETYGQLLMELGRPDDALDHLRTALQFTERAIEQDPSLRSRHHDIGASHDAIAEVLRQQGRPEEALASSRQAEQAFREGLRSLPQDRNLRHALGCNMEKRALIVAALGDRENGVVHLRESLGMHRANLEANHTDRQAMSALASTISNLGSFAFSRGRPREIEELCADLAPWTLTLLASNPTDPDAVEACAELARWRGWALSDLGKPEEALAVAEQAMTAIDALPAASRSPDLARVWTYLGEIRGMSLRNLRRYDAAIALERDIVKRREGFVAESHDATSSHFLLVGLDNLRRSLAAAKLGDELLATDERRVALADSFVAAHATSHELRADLVSALIDAGQTRLDHGVDRTGAEAHWQRALRLLEDMLEERDDARLLASFEALLSRLRALEGK